MNMSHNGPFWASCYEIMLRLRVIKASHAYLATSVPLLL